MTWEEIKNRKEDSIRESTNNPMPKSITINEKQYKSYSDYLNSDEYKEFIRLEEKAKDEHDHKAKDYFESLAEDDQLLVFYHITKCIYNNYFVKKGSYRGLLYDELGFGPEAYSLGCESGMFNVHNAISTPDDLEDRFKKLVDHLKLDLTKAELRSLRHVYLYGFDSTKSMDDLNGGQKRFDFTKDPE